MDVVSVIMIMITGLWLFLPAMIPNSAAVVFGGKTKIDFGKSWRGRRIFGDGSPGGDSSEERSPVSPSDSS